MSDKISENFDVLEVKLKGTNLIEAAAGTGKTYSIAIMVLRWILSTDNPIDSVIAVTFTNYATAELKERILNFLEDALAFFEAGKCKDETIQQVCREIQGNGQEKAIKKLKAAINDFDTASIFTIHGFCQKLIREHAFELGTDFNMKLSEDADPENDAATAFFRHNIINCKECDQTGTGLLAVKDFRNRVSREKLKDFISKAGIGIENTKILVDTDKLNPDTSAKLARIYEDFIKDAPFSVREKREKTNLMGFDDILLILYEVLRKGGKAAQTLKKIMEERYSFVLIDEFQDTDPLQYLIFKTLFCNGGHTVFFIGDPKQSIYAFRKADIFAYIEARKEVDHIYKMTKNFRSASAAVEATNKVFNMDSENIFGRDKLIKYDEVDAEKKENEYCLLSGDRPFYGMIVRQIPDQAGDKIKEETVKKMMTEHIAQTIREMIKKDSVFKIREKKNNVPAERAVTPSDIAVLVATNDFALEICEKLKTAGIPAVVEADNAKQLAVFSSTEALAMQRLISAASTKGLAEFKTLLLTFFYNKTVDDIAGENDLLTELHREFVSCFSEWEEKGFYFSFSKLLKDETVLRSIAAEGTRTVSIIRQLAELIQKHESSEGFSALRTRKWFNNKINSKSSGNEEENIRTENEKKECVRIMTLHKSKGLEFNIVFFPFILKSQSKEQWITRHSKSGSGGGYEREIVLTSKGGPETDEALEENRRIYVGITRAKYLTVCYTQEKKDFLEQTSFFQRNEPEIINTRELKIEKTENLNGIEENKPSSAPELIPPEEATREIKPEWMLTSFSGIISRGQNEESLENEDESLDPAENTENRAGSEDETKTVPMALFPSGTEEGTVLHSIFEEADFSCTDNSQIIRAILKKKMNFGSDGLENAVSTVNECLNSVCSSPVFDGGGTLRDVQKSKTAEMEFFLLIKNDVLEGKLSKIIEDNYRTAKLETDSVKKGFLHGYIDLVAEFNGKYYIIDWKSNNLGNSYSDYDKKNIEAEMKKHNYYLQYMLYLAAFDRYMQTVDKQYSYENFGGIRYVFLRGVKAGSIETGIFSDRPEESELRKIQKLFEGEK
ncbi:UvrD-helicase domain-containing protein [bacterium]|nr:UvrD-helicase domain-containing protein [bacterium]